MEFRNTIYAEEILLSTPNCKFNIEKFDKDFGVLGTKLTARLYNSKMTIPNPGDAAIGAGNYVEITCSSKTALTFDFHADYLGVHILPINERKKIALKEKDNKKVFMLQSSNFQKVLEKAKGFKIDYIKAFVNFNFFEIRNIEFLHQNGFFATPNGLVLSSRQII